MSESANTVEVKEKVRTSKKIIRIISWVLVGVIVIFALWLTICSFTGKVPMLFGHGVIRLQSGSMEGDNPDSIKTNTFILIESVEPSEISEGDIITFISDASDPVVNGHPNTHRVISIQKNDDGSFEFVTKGDANFREDDATAKGEKLIGRYVRKLHILTAVFAVVSKPYVFWPIVLILLGLMLFWCFKDLFKSDKPETDEELMKRVAEEVERMKREAAEAEAENSKKADADSKATDNDAKKD